MSEADNRARVVCERVARRIAEVAPREIARFPETWALVAGVSDRFLDALRAWEDADSETTRSSLSESVDELIAGWRDAVRAWEAMGRPGEPSEETRVTRG